MLKQWAFPLIHIPIYSLNFDLPLLLDHIILFGRLRLGLGIASYLQDWGYTLPSTGAESISLWYSQSSYSLIEIIIVSGNYIQEIEPWRWRLKTMYAPCCSRGADMLFLPREMVWRWLTWGGEGSKTGLAFTCLQVDLWISPSNLIHLERIQNPQDWF